MSKNCSYILVLRGCDDINKCKIDFFNGFEKDIFIFYSRHMNSNCKNCCQPSIHLFYGDSELYDKLNLYNLSEFDDLVGGYYE